MRVRPWHKLLLAAALVFGQSLAIAHDYQHPALGGDQACQVCVHGPGFQAGPAVMPELAEHGLAGESPLHTPTLPALARRHTHAPIRAPPHSFV